MNWATRYRLIFSVVGVLLGASFLVQAWVEGVGHHPLLLIGGVLMMVGSVATLVSIYMDSRDPAEKP